MKMGDGATLPRLFRGDCDGFSMELNSEDRLRSGLSHHSKPSAGRKQPRQQFPVRPIPKSRRRIVADRFTGVFDIFAGAPYGVTTGKGGDQRHGCEQSKY